MARVLGLLLSLAVLAALWASSCYSPPHPDCGFRCGSGDACPADYACNSVDHICHLNGTPAEMLCAVDAAIGNDAQNDADLTAPTVIATTPTDGATGVSRTLDITASFSQPLMPGSVGGSTFIIMNGLVPVPGTIFYDQLGGLARFTPNPPLPAGATISVQLTPGITNTNGVPLVGYAFSFTTLDDEAPTLATSSPLDLDVNVPVTTTIDVTFSEQVANVDGTSFTVTQGATGITGTISTLDNITYTFTPAANLPAASVITVDLTGAIADLASNPLAPVQFTFTTQ